MIFQTPFFGRSQELQLLDRLWHSTRPELLVLYGRPRVGKTRLLSAWITNASPRVLSWSAAREPALSSPLPDPLRSFSQAVANFEQPGSSVPADFTYASWEQAFQQVSRLAEKGRLMVVLEDFANLMDAYPAIVGHLQHIWDHQFNFPRTNAFLVLVGQHENRMNREVLSYSAPLYGRATALLHLRPFPFAATQTFFPAYTPEERVAVYAMLGGVPGYWERFDPEQSLRENIRHCFLSDGQPSFQNELACLLPASCNLPAHRSILRAMAYGKGRLYSTATPAAIAKQAGLPRDQVLEALPTLMETGFVDQHLPVTARPTTRARGYRLIDPFLRFHFRFLAARQDDRNGGQRPAGNQARLLNRLERALPSFIAAHTWPELCQEWALWAGRRRLPFWAGEIGRVWGRDFQVEVVGWNRRESALILGTCRWRLEPQGPEVLRHLVDKTPAVIPSFGLEKSCWQIFYLGFARGGWTQAAQEFAAHLVDSVPCGEIRVARNPGVAGAHLLDEAQLERDLVEWWNESLMRKDKEQDEIPF